MGVMSCPPHPNVLHLVVLVLLAVLAASHADHAGHDLSGLALAALFLRCRERATPLSQPKCLRLSNDAVPLLNRHMQGRCGSACVANPAL